MTEIAIDCLRTPESTCSTGKKTTMLKCGLKMFNCLDMAGKVQIYLISRFEIFKHWEPSDTLSLSAESSSLNPTSTSLPAPRITGLRPYGSRHLEVNFGENLQSDHPSSSGPGECDYSVLTRCSFHCVAGFRG